MSEKSGTPGISDGSGHAGEVFHNAGKLRYEWRAPGAAASADETALAVLEYTLEPDTSNDRGRNRMIFTHTFVPPEMRGMGVAEKLVRTGLADARSHGRHVVPECSYVARFIERHLAEYGDLVNR